MYTGRFFTLLFNVILYPFTPQRGIQKKLTTQTSRHMFKFILPIVFILIDWYFFTGVQTIIRDFPQQRKVTIQTAYWIVSGLTIFCLIALGVFSQASLPNFFRGYVVSIIFILFLSKFLACVFLLLDDINMPLRSNIRNKEKVFPG